MSWDQITEAEIQVKKPVGPTLWRKVKDCLDYLFGTIGGIPPINGNFEVDSDGDGIPDNWTRTLYPGGTGGRDTTTPAQGAAAIYLVHPGGAGNGGGELWSDYLPVSEYASYFVKFIHWATAAGMKNKVQVQYYTAAKAANGSPVDLYNSTSNPTTPTFFTRGFQPTANTRFVKIVLIGGYTDTAIAGTAYFDHVEFGVYPSDIARGEAVLLCSASEVTFTEGAYTLQKEIRLHRSGTFTVMFDLKAASGATAYGRIYKNGVAHGTARSTASTADVTYSEDLAFEAGDLCQLYCYRTGAATSYCNDFKVCGSDENHGALTKE